jgi:hypothetical protein
VRGPAPVADFCVRACGSRCVRWLTCPRLLSVSGAAAQAPRRTSVCGDDGAHRATRRRNALEQAIQSGVTSADSLPDVQAQAAAREALHNDLAQFVDAARLALGPPFLKARPALALPRTSAPSADTASGATDMVTYAKVVTDAEPVADCGA